MVPRIVLGVVTSPKDRAIAERVHEAIRQLAPRPAKIVFAEVSSDKVYRDWLAAAGWEVLPVDAKGAASEHAAGRDAISRYALKHGYSHALFVEGDILLPEKTLALLCEDPQAVVAGVYLGPAEIEGRMMVAPMLAARREVPVYGRCLPVNLVIESKRLDLGGIGFGCVLIETQALEKIDFRVARSSFDASDAIRKQGYNLFADTRVKCIHVYNGVDLTFPASIAAMSFETEV